MQSSGFNSIFGTLRPFQGNGDGLAILSGNGTGVTIATPLDVIGRILRAVNFNVGAGSIHSLFSSRFVATNNINNRTIIVNSHIVFR
jgi:hypothetical protein